MNFENGTNVYVLLGDTKYYGKMVGSTVITCKNSSLFNVWSNVQVYIVQLDEGFYSEDKKIKNNFLVVDPSVVFEA